MVDRRDAGEVPGRRRRLHQLRRPAPGPRLRPAERGRAAGRDHLGRGVRGAAVRQPHGDPDAHRRPAPDGVPQRVHAVLRPRLRRRHRPLPADLRAQGARSTATASTPVVDGMWKTPDGIGGHADPDRPGPTRSASSRTTSCTAAATATPSSPRARTSLQPGDDLLQVTIDYITAHSPVDPRRRGADRRAVDDRPDPNRESRSRAGRLSCVRVPTRGVARPVRILPCPSSTTPSSTTTSRFSSATTRRSGSSGSSRSTRRCSAPRPAAAGSIRTRPRTTRSPTCCGSPAG